MSNEKTTNPQTIETTPYVPQYRVKSEFRDAVLKAIGDRPFNEIASLVAAINVSVIDHNTLTQIINVLGQFPYVRIAPILTNVNSYVEQIIEED